MQLNVGGEKNRPVNHADHKQPALVLETAPWWWDARHLVEPATAVQKPADNMNGMLLEEAPGVGQ